MPKLYKFLKLKDGEIVSDADENCVWKIGEWKENEGKIECCRNGFHASKEVFDALCYVKGEILAEVEAKGKSDKEKDKQAWGRMRLTKAWSWTKADSVALSVFSARLCLARFEKEFPDDERPRLAIEAAEKWLDEPTDKNMSAAWSAAESAESAARSAESAAKHDKFLKLTLKEINKWILNHLKDMETYGK